MQSISKKLMLGAVAVALAAAGSVAMARGDCAWGKSGKSQWTPERAEAMQERMSSRVEQQLARVELALALQPEQRTAWESFQQGMLSRVDLMAGSMAAGFSGDRPVSAQEQLAVREQMAETRLEMMRQSRASVSALYAVLGDAQKKVFDAEFERMMSKGSKGPQGERGHRGMQ